MAQRVLVTAGASGIGKEIARAFLASGAKVCVCDIDLTALETAAKDIPGLITKVCDISKRQDIEQPQVALSRIPQVDIGLSGRPEKPAPARSDSSGPNRGSRKLRPNGG